MGEVATFFPERRKVQLNQTVSGLFKKASTRWSVLIPIDGKELWRLTVFDDPASSVDPEELLRRMAGGDFPHETLNVSRWERGEEKALETYGTSDEKGFVRIPLKEAMQIVVGQLPARKPADQPKYPDRGLIDAGESNSGRMFRGGSP